jgi:hypothetical protein
VALFVSMVSVLMLKPKLKPRKSGPIIEWDAFKEGPYLLYMLGGFLFFWALYFGFFYVSMLTGPLEKRRNLLFLDQRLCAQRHPLFHHGFGPAPSHHERNERAEQAGDRLSSRPILWAHQSICFSDASYGVFDLCVDWCDDADWDVCVLRLLRPFSWRGPGAICRLIG